MKFIHSSLYYKQYISSDLHLLDPAADAGNSDIPKIIYNMFPLRKIVKVLDLIRKEKMCMLKLLR